MKRIILTDKQLKRNLGSILTKLKAQGTITLNQLYKIPEHLEKNIIRPKIIITPTAADKMTALVDVCDLEIAWHNTVTRDGSVFTVHDTLCYPQTVAATAVEADDYLYPEWQEELETPVYNELRMQGHSHVNMGVSPSHTDETYYNTLLQHVKSFYIFIIVNKRGDMYARIYDKQYNIIYENKDIDIEIQHTPINLWASDQMDKYVTVQPYHSAKDTLFNEAPTFKYKHY